MSRAELDTAILGENVETISSLLDRINEVSFEQLIKSMRKPKITEKTISRLLILSPFRNNINKDANDGTLLMLAVSFGRLDLVKLFCDLGIDPNIVDSDGLTALHWAYRLEEEEVESLETKAMIIDFLNKITDPILKRRAFLYSIEDDVSLLTDAEIDMFIERAKSIDYFTEEMGLLPSMALSSLVGKEDIDGISLFLSKGVDIERPYGWSPLFSAALQYQGHCRSGKNVTKILRIIKSLIDNGASIGTCDASGYTPLMAAAGADLSDLLILLLDRGAEIDLPNNEGITPLMFAVGEGYIENTMILLERGADRGIKDRGGKTVSYYLDYVTKPGFNKDQNDQTKYELKRILNL